METFLTTQREVILHQPRLFASDLQMVRAKPIRVSERHQGSSYLHFQILRALHSKDEMEGVLQLLDVLREVAEEHPCVGHTALCSPVTESLVHQRAVHPELYAVLPQVHATVRFVEIEFPMNWTQSHIHPLIFFAKLDRHHAHLAKLLSRYELTHLIIVNTVREPKTFAQQSCHCTNTRPSQLLYVDFRFSNLLLTKGPSRLFRYFRYSRLNGNRNVNRPWRRCVHLRRC